jgi:hypothetical protein
MSVASVAEAKNCEIKKRLFNILTAVAYFKSLGVETASQHMVRTLIVTGQIAHVRLGKSYYVSQAALDGWLSNHERKAK